MRKLSDKTDTQPDLTLVATIEKTIGKGTCYTNSLQPNINN